MGQKIKRTLRNWGCGLLTVIILATGGYIYWHYFFVFGGGHRVAYARTTAIQLLPLLYRRRRAGSEAHAHERQNRRTQLQRVSRRRTLARIQRIYRRRYPLVGITAHHISATPAAARQPISIQRHCNRQHSRRKRLPHNTRPQLAAIVANRPTTHLFTRPLQQVAASSYKNTPTLAHNICIIRHHAFSPLQTALKTSSIFTPFPPVHTRDNL